MRRRIVILASALSLLLCVATFVLWSRSWWVGDLVYWNCYDEKGAFRGFNGTYSVRGHVAYMFVAASAPLPVSPVRGVHMWTGTGKLPPRSFYDVPIVPVGVLSLICLLLPLTCVAMRARMRLLPQAGQCVVCRYDLTGNTSGVCPECGTAVRT